MTRYTYQHLLELVEGDHELITLLVADGEIVDEIRNRPPHVEG